MLKFSTTFLFLFLFTISTFAQQPLPFERVSPKAMVKQYLGNFISIEIEYSRPAKNDRVVFGNLVKEGLEDNSYGNAKPMPWRLGANENTVIHLSHNAMIGDDMLPAGSYSMHMIYGKDKSTLIFNKNTSAWGSYFYEESEDVLRVAISAKEMNHIHEWLQFDLIPVTQKGMDMKIKWDSLEFIVPIRFDYHNIQLDEFDKLLTNLSGFNPGAYAQAASYSLSNKAEFERGITYIDQAIKMTGESNATYIFTKTMLLMASENRTEAQKWEDKAVAKANESDVLKYSKQLLAMEKTDQAEKVLRSAVKKFKKNFDLPMALGDHFASKGDAKQAKRYYKIAYKNAPSGKKNAVKRKMDKL